MRKYICNACGIRICTAEYQSGSGIPMKCTALIDKYCKAAWQEVKEEAAEVERPAKEEKALPDWCKVERHGFDNEQKRYFEIVYINKKWVDIEYLDDGNGETVFRSDMQKCSEAVKRPFNEDEMKALVGKALKNDTGIYLVTAFENRWNQVKIESVWRDADELKKVWTQLDGKPCYVLEHKNEKGEWVK